MEIFHLWTCELIIYVFSDILIYSGIYLYILWFLSRLTVDLFLSETIKLFSKLQFFKIVCH